MPYSPTRACRTCGEERATPDDFRDLGVTGPGRPPTSCRECRETHPEVAEAYAQAVESRPRAAVARAIRRARTPEQVERDRRRKRPDGVKLCPALSGCGELLPFHAFAPNLSLIDGLQTVCAECKATYPKRGTP